MQIQRQDLGCQPVGRSHRAARPWLVAVALLTCSVLATASPAPLRGDEAEVSSQADMQTNATHGETGHGETGHGGADHAPGTNPMVVDPDLALVTAIIFVLLLLVLWKFAWGPLITAIDRRERHLKENLEEAERQHAQAKRLLADYQEKLTQAGAQVRALLEEARKDAELQKQKILDQAQATAQAEKERAVREIEAAKVTALRELGEKSVELAVDMAGRIVRDKISPEDRQRLIQESLKQLPSNN